MSSNLDLVRSIYADWEQGDLSRFDWVDPEIELVVDGGLFPVHAKGLADVAATVRGGVLSEMADWHDVAEEYRELDANRVLVLDRFSGRGRASGVSLARTPTHSARVFEIHNGKVTRLVIYWNRNRALADLGLTPEGDG